MKLKSQILTIVLFVLMFLSILPPQKAMAHDVYFLRVVVNRDTWLYEGRVEYDEVGGLKGEKKHKEAVLGNFYGMKDSVSSKLSDYNLEGTGTNEMIFSFPYTEIKGGLDGVNNATAKDADRAYAISNVLIPNLNQMLVKINDNNPFLNAEELSEATQKIITASNGTSTTHNGWSIDVKPSSDIITISKSGSGSQDFIYRMEKGYKEAELEDGKPNPLYNPELSGDATYISVGMLAAQGLYSLEVKALSADKLDEVNKPGLLESQISKLIINLSDGMRDLLGLHSIDDLVYSQGPRMDYGYSHGVAKKSWMDTAVSFHAIFQVLAWIVMAFAIIKIMFEKTLSTFSVFKQISLTNSVKNLWFTGIILAAAYPLIQGLLVLNTSFTSIFATTTSFSSMGGASSSNASIAQALLSIVYLFIAIYLNIMYILRGLIIVILIASAPLFIASMAFSSRGGNLFFKWLRELVANIFIQSIHAFVLGMLLTLQIGSGALEMLVISFALIPMTKFFKNLIIGESGGAIADVAGNVTSAGVGAAAGFAGGLARKGGGGKSSSGKETSGKEHSADNASENTSFSNEGVSGNKKLSATHSTSISTTDADIIGSRQSYGASSASLPESVPDNGFRARAQNVMDKTTNAMSSNASNIGNAALKTAAFAGKTVVAAPVLAGLGAIGGAQGVTSGVNIMRDGGAAIKRGAKSAGNAFSSIKNEYSNADGSTTYLRDRNELANMGYEYAGNAGSGASVTYDESRLSATDMGYLNKIKDAYRENPDALKEKGIDRVSESGGNVKVTYNKSGKEYMGFSSISTSQKYIREIKSPQNSQETSFIYDIDSYGSSGVSEA